MFWLDLAGNAKRAGGIVRLTWLAIVLSLLSQIGRLRLSGPNLTNSLSTPKSPEGRTGKADNGTLI